MLVLAILPLLILLIRVIFTRCAKMRTLIGKINDKMYYNMYIRFGLEAYLELALVSSIRFKKYSFSDANEKFHSFFATTLYLGILLYFSFSIYFLQTRFASLKTEAIQKRYGALYLGLETKRKMALLFPCFFMLRRLILAWILVYWSQKNYFQV